MAVHPHSRGEHRGDKDRPPSNPGSSPLARGTLRVQRDERRFQRFIPTRAGNTRQPPSVATVWPVHPHSRGEHPLITVIGIRIAGSSPLARGTRSVRFSTERTGRFIPTRAGNTRHGRSRLPNHPVHPHSRGEHSAAPQLIDYATGSSPLARGTRVERRPVGELLRFIPTRAGNTCWQSAAGCGPSVHPHSRGEHGGLHVAGLQGGGSSPLARGTLQNAKTSTRRVRFIPTRAGNTWARAPRPWKSPVHPHSRGEHADNPGVGAAFYGSSPLARGTPVLGSQRLVPGWFIPTRAGNTRAPSFHSSIKPVHPHSRGEHFPLTL